MTRVEPPTGKAGAPAAGPVDGNRKAATLLLRHPDYAKTYTAQVISLFGDNLVPVALAFAVLDGVGGAGSLGVILAARTLATVLFLLLGGVMADRISRLTLMILADLLRLGSQATVAVLLITARATVPELCLLMAVHGAAGAFFKPASTGVVPLLLPQNCLGQANALSSFATSVNSVMGPAIAGLLVATTSPAVAIGLDAGTFAASAVLNGWLRLRLGEKARPMSVQRTGVVRELADGWRTIAVMPWLRVSIAAFSLYQLLALACLLVLGPVVARDAMNGASSWAIVASSLGIGSVAGSLLVSKVRWRRPLRAMHLGLAPTALLLASLAFPLPLPFVAGCAIADGVGLAMATTLWMTALQSRVPPDRLSRVSSWDWLGSVALRPLGYLFFGYLVAVTGTRVCLLGCAAALLLIQTVTARAVGIRHAGNAAPQPAAPST